MNEEIINKAIEIFPLDIEQKNWAIKKEDLRDLLQLRLPLEAAIKILKKLETEESKEWLTKWEIK